MLNIELVNSKIDGKVYKYMHTDNYVELVFNKEPFEYSFISNKRATFGQTLIQFLEERTFTIGDDLYLLYTDDCVLAPITDNIKYDLTNSKNGTIFTVDMCQVWLEVGTDTNARSFNVYSLCRNNTKIGFVSISTDIKCIHISESLSNNTVLIERIKKHFNIVDDKTDVLNKDWVSQVLAPIEDGLTGIYETNRTPIFELLHTAAFLMNGILYMPDTFKPFYVKINRYRNPINTDGAISVYQDYTKYGELIDYMERIGGSVFVGKYTLPNEDRHGKYYYIKMINIFVVYRVNYSFTKIYLFYKVDNRLNNLLTAFVESKNAKDIGLIDELYRKDLTKVVNDVCGGRDLNILLQNVFKTKVLKLNK